MPSSNERLCYPRVGIYSAVEAVHCDEAGWMAYMFLNAEEEDGGDKEAYFLEWYPDIARAAIALLSAISRYQREKVETVEAFLDGAEYALKKKRF